MICIVKVFFEHCFGNEKKKTGEMKANLCLLQITCIRVEFYVNFCMADFALFYYYIFFSTLPWAMPFFVV